LHTALISEFGKKVQVAILSTIGPFRAKLTDIHISDYLNVCGAISGWNNGNF